MSKIQTKSRVYVTTDQMEFSTQTEAEDHQSLVDAHAALEKAAGDFVIALAKSCKTIDGKKFNFAERYYVIEDGFGFVPELKELVFYNSDARFSYMANGALFITPYVHSDVFMRGDFKRSYYEISKLYSSRRDAEKVLLSKLESLVVERQQAVDKLRASLID